MSAGWVAGSVRGRLLTSRRLGIAGARAVAAAGSTEAAVTRLADRPYGRDVRPGMSASDARRAIGSVCLWHLRVLAGWLPARAVDVVRVFAARFELANIADRLAGAHAAPEPYALGTLAVAWPRVAAAPTAEDVRLVLATSAWGDPGTADWPAAGVALEARWASWLAGAVPDMGAWAAGAAALVVARRVAAGRPVPPAALGDLRRQLGSGWEGARDLVELRDRVPRAGAWVLDGIDTSSDVWVAEGHWWRRVDRDAADTLRRGRPGPPVAAAAAARLVADAWRTEAALEAASWGPAGVEVFDAVA